jgi:hypothetical protein
MPPDYTPLGLKFSSRERTDQPPSVQQADHVVFDVDPPVLGIAIEFRIKAHAPSEQIAVTFLGVDVVAEPTVSSVSYGEGGACDTMGDRNFTVLGEELHLSGTPTVTVGAVAATILDVRQNEASSSALASAIVVRCPTDLGGTDRPVTLALPDATVAQGSVSVDFEPPTISDVLQAGDAPPAGGTTLEIVGRGWGSGLQPPTVTIDGEGATIVNANDTVVTVRVPPQSPGSASPSAVSVVVSYDGVDSVAAQASIAYAPPTLDPLSPPSLSYPIAGDETIVIVGLHFGEGQAYSVRVGGVYTVPPGELDRHNDTHILWSPTWATFHDRLGLGCDANLTVSREGDESTPLSLTWNKTPVLDTTSAFLSTNPLGYVEVTGTNLGPAARARLVVVDGADATIATVPVAPNFGTSADRRLFRLPSDYAYAADHLVRYAACDDTFAPADLPLTPEPSGSVSSCVVYLSPPSPGESPRWWLNGAPLDGSPADAQCRGGDRLVFGWDFSPFTNQTASACVRDTAPASGAPDCSPTQPLMGGASQFEPGVEGGAHCVSLGDAYEGDVISVVRGQCVQAVPAGAGSRVCLTAQLSGDNVNLPHRWSSCVSFTASSCSLSQSDCSSTCGTDSPAGLCADRSTVDRGATAAVCRPNDSTSCTCQCSFDAGAVEAERYSTVPPDFIPLVAGWQAVAPTTPTTTTTTTGGEGEGEGGATTTTTTTATTTTSSSSTASPATPDATDAREAFVYGLVTLDGTPPFLLTNLPGDPIVVFAYRASESERKRRATAEPVDASFDPLLHIDYERGPLSDGDTVADRRLVLRAPREEEGEEFELAEGLALTYVDGEGEGGEVAVDEGVLGVASDTMGAEVRAGGGTTGTLSLAEIALVVVASLGCVAAAAYLVSQRRRGGSAEGPTATSSTRLTAVPARDVELASSTDSLSPKGLNHTYSSPPVSFSPAHSRGKAATTSVGSATTSDGRETTATTTTTREEREKEGEGEGEGDGDDANSPYVLPPVRGDDEDLREKVRTSVPRKFLVLPEDLDRGSLIGQGGYGYVYRGVWREVSVAIKEIREVPDPAVSREAVKQMVEEALLMVDLRPHTNLIQFFGICLDPMSIVLEFAARGSLEDALYGKAVERRIPFSPAERLAIALGAGRGVNHLHQEGVVHRDLASRNVLLTAALVPKLTDFGMARTAEEETTTTTATRVGPIRWMAPEQLADQVVSTASDVWAFGCLLYEIYAADQPFGSSMKNLVVAKRVMDGGHVETPAEAPPAVREAMAACFVHAHRDRPKMKAVLGLLSEEGENK